MKWIKSIGLMVLLMLSVQSVFAHQLRPAIVSLEFNQNGSLNAKIELNLESIIAGIGANHQDTDDAPEAARYNELRALDASELEQQFLEMSEGFIKQLSVRFDEEKADLKFIKTDIPDTGDVENARLSTLHLTAQLPTSKHNVTWQYPEKFGNSVVHFYYADKSEQKTSHWLTEGKQSSVFILNASYSPKSFADIAWEYTVLGFEHIVPKGLDHILFVLGLFLLSVRFKPLLLQVTAFTIAHSITLGLTIFGVISLSPDIIEPIIALSIVYVGIENILVKELKPWRVMIVFIFGLLHGMGFAGVLSELGLPESDFTTALIFFNIGVEAGQLAVIMLAFMCVFWLIKDQRRYRQIVIIPGSILIALVGLYWTVERVFL